MINFVCSILLGTMPLFAFSQDKRWMYLETSGKAIIEADTLKSDIQEFSNHEGHESVVVFWIRATEPVKTKSGRYKMMHITKMAVDTANRQVLYKSDIEYRNNKAVKSKTYEYPEWHDIIPGSVGEVFLNYARSINNSKLYIDLMIHATIYAIKNKKYNHK